MSDLKLEITPKGLEVLAGAMVPIKLTLSNAGKAPVEVPDPAMPSPFEYRLLDAGGGVRKLSAQAIMLARGPDARPPPARMRSLAPGQSFDYPQDLAGLVASPLAPGRYTVTAEWSRSGGPLLSPTIDLGVLPADVRSLALGESRFDHGLSMVFSHASSTNTELYQRSSLATNPEDGVAHLRLASPKGTPVTDVAMAQELAVTQEGHWFAWLQGDSIGAGAGKGKATYGRTDATATGLKGLRLHPTGWQANIKSATFAALGFADADRPHLLLASWLLGKPPVFTDVALAPAKRPEQWTVQRLEGGEPARYDVVWVETSSKRGMVLRQKVVADGSTPERAEPLLQMDHPLLALAGAALAGPGKRFVDALVSADDAKGQPILQWLQIALDDSVRPGRLDLPLPPGWPAKADWALGRSPSGVPTVAMLSDHRLFLLQAGAQAQWKQVAEASGTASLPRLVNADGKAWLVWAESGRGLRFLSLK